jgi:hypothetical protein
MMIAGNLNGHRRISCTRKVKVFSISGIENADQQGNREQGLIYKK